MTAQEEEKARQHYSDPCFYCAEPCEPFAGNPGRWPLIFCQPDGTGRIKAHHIDCVMQRLSATETALADARRRGWEAGRDAAAKVADDLYSGAINGTYEYTGDIADAIRALGGGEAEAVDSAPEAP